MMTYRNLTPFTMHSWVPTEHRSYQPKFTKICPVRDILAISPKTTCYVSVMTRNARNKFF